MCAPMCGGDGIDISALGRLLTVTPTFYVLDLYLH